MADVYSLGDYKEEYINLLQDYDFNPNDIVATGNLIGFLHKYIFSPRWKLMLNENLDQMVDNKRSMLQKLIDVLMKDRHEEIALLADLEMAQAEFFYGDWELAEKIYRHALDTEMDRLGAKEIDPDDDYFTEIVVDLVHNLRTIYHLTGNDDFAQSIRDDANYWFENSLKFYQNFVKEYPRDLLLTKKKVYLQDHDSSLYLTSSSYYGDTINGIQTNQGEYLDLTHGDVLFEELPCLTSVSNGFVVVGDVSFKTDDPTDTVIYMFDSSLVN